MSPVAYLQSERGLSIAGMCIPSRERPINRRHVYTKQREVYQSMACVYQAERGLSIAGMCIQSRQREVYQSPACVYKADRERSINRRHVYTQQREIYQAPACVYKADRERSINRRHVYTKQTASTRTPSVASVVALLPTASRLLNTSNCKVIGHLSIETHHFSGEILHSFCIFNRKIRKKLAFLLKFATHASALPCAGRALLPSCAPRPYLQLQRDLSIAGMHIQSRRVPQYLTVIPSCRHLGGRELQSCVFYIIKSRFFNRKSGFLIANQDS